MTKADSIVALEAFRQSVMLSVNSLPVDSDVKSNIIIRFQAFYLSMLTELVTTPVISNPPSANP
jgi:hypothetical protein